MAEEQSESQDSGQSVSKELRDVRYCEVIPVTREGAKLTSWVYNTLGLNDCPAAAEWDALTEDEVNEAYGSVAAKLNGPRYWVIDKLVASGSTTTGQTFNFGGIEMELRAKLETRPREGARRRDVAPFNLPARGVGGRLGRRFRLCRAGP